MNSINFYNKFHKKTKVQEKIIDENNFTYKLLTKDLSKLLERKNKLRILDYGCGVGTLSFYSSSFGHKVTGVDISPSAINAVENNLKNIQLKNITFFTLEKFISKKNEFDLIICSEVIEHVEDDRALIKIFHSLLNEDGILFLTTPSKNAPLVKLGLTANFDKKVGHLRRYDKRIISKLFLEEGFKITNIVEREGVIRNSLFVIPVFGFLVKFVKGPFVNLITLVDNLTIPIFGASDIVVTAVKK